MNVLITGIDGFVGGHLARHLADQEGVVITGTTYNSTDQYPHLSQLGASLFQVDLTNEEEVVTLLEREKPDMIYHLAALANVQESHHSPWPALKNNIQAQLNILHGVVTTKISPRVLVVGSAEEYGSVSATDNPIDELQELRPQSPYAVSKVSQDMLGLQYFLAHGVQTIRVRPFNHTGPGQGRGFVAPDFASQIAAIEQGIQSPAISVGNLEAARDFTDVRDVVKAYVLLLQHGEAGSVYNVGSGQACTIRQVLETLLSESIAKIDILIDPLRFRPVETPLVVCDASRLKRHTGWSPEIQLRQTLADVLNDWRTRQPDTL